MVTMEKEEDNVQRPEELINRYVTLLAATANITRGVGALALLWSSVVLLGGFVTALGTQEFWLLTVLSFLMAFGVVDIWDSEYKRGIYLEELKIFAFIGRQKWIHKGVARCQQIFLGMVLLPKLILITCLVMWSFNVTPFVSIIISVWHLVRRDYGSDGGDVANTAKLIAALDIFYALVLFQSLLVLYWAALDVMFRLSTVQVAIVTSKQCGDEKWSSKLVDMYRSETRVRFKKDGELPDNWNLITYGLELLQSPSGDDDHRWGARVLNKLFDEDKSVIRRELLSSKPSIQNLIGMISRRGVADDGIENRERAARIVAHLATDLHITSFPGTLQCICSLLESTTSCEPKLHSCPSGNPDEPATLLADENNQHGSPDTSEHQDDHAYMGMLVPAIRDQTDEGRQVVVVSSSSSGLADKRKRTTLRERIKKIIEDNPNIREPKRRSEVRKFSESKYRRSYKSRGAKELISQGLLILERLAQDEGNCTEISKDQRLISKITAPLMRSTSHDDFLTKLRDNTMVEMLSKSLTVLSKLLTSPGDGATRLRQKLATNTEVVSNLMGILETDSDSEGAQKLHEPALEILTELAFDDSFKEVDFDKLFKALLCIFLQKEANSTTVQEPNNATAQVDQADITEKATRRLMRGRAAEALARLLPLGTARCTLSKQMAINVLTTVLNEISSSKIGTTADTSTEPGGSNSGALEITIVGSQPLGEADTDGAQPLAEENEKQSEERKFVSAMLSLAVVIYNDHVISNEDFAYLATPEDDEALAKKLKEILQAINKNGTAECLRIVKFICQVVIAMTTLKPSCIQNFNGQNFKEALAEAMEAMSEVEDCMLFAWNDREVIKPVRSLASLVKEAQEFLQAA